MNLVVVAGSPLPRILDFARERGWRHLRLLSTAGNGYNRAYHGQTAEGHDVPMVNVFRRDGDTIRHFWGSELLFEPIEPDQEPRHTEGYDPIWAVLDLTPGGRGIDWHPQLSYA